MDQYIVGAAIALALFWVVAAVWRRNRRARHTDVPPVSEQWLAERRGKQE